MGKFLIIICLVLSSFNSKNTADSALQSVLELEEVQSYFSKSPRFTTSRGYTIHLIKEAGIDLNDQPSVNSIPLQVINKNDNIHKEDLNVFIELEQLKVDGKMAKVGLIIQNAQLRFEQKKKVKLEAKLQRTEVGWKVDKYSSKKVNISE